jgi:hypothetical protein
MKQKEYRETYSLAQDAPCQIDNDAYKGTPWFCFGLRRGIGAISLDSRFLIRA